LIPEYFTSHSSIPKVFFMLPTLLDQYRRWFEYEKDSHRKVLAALETVPTEHRGSEAFRKAMSLMGHIVAARRMWLFRFGASTTRPHELFPSDVTREQLLAELESMEIGWSQYLQRLDGNELSRAFEYKSIDSGWFRSTVVDILTQLHGHSLYHRGQIAALIRAAGGQPVETDFVFWSREPISAPGR
jgi:uncharacterized damage-inducible protein DinB